MAPTNQNPDIVAAWIEDLVGFAAGSLFLLDSGDATPSSLIVDATAKYVAVHYGNFGGQSDPLGKATIAYDCASDCGTFTPETMAGFALLGAGLVALSQMRRRTTG